VPGLLALLFFAKLCATSVSLGSGASGGIFSPSLFMGATIGGAFGAAISAIHPIDGLGVTTCAMIGMAAMVGGGTGAAMTAVTMIFEMTRDYDLVMPIIVAVALAIRVRRLLSQENIYTVKLVGRKHFVPKALHANMFLVRRAGEVMERDVTLLPKDTRLETFLRKVDHEGRMKHIVVTDGDRVVGVLRVNTALRRGLEDVEQSFTVGEIAQRNYTVARQEDIVFDVVTRMTRHDASMVVVSKAKRRPRVGDVLGVITKEHIADSVADSIKPYGE
jgi:CIC family chloride channel protein